MFKLTKEIEKNIYDLWFSFFEHGDTDEIAEQQFKIVKMIDEDFAILNTALINTNQCCKDEIEMRIKEVEQQECVDIKFDSRR